MNNKVILGLLFAALATPAMAQDQSQGQAQLQQGTDLMLAQITKSAATLSNAVNEYYKRAVAAETQLAAAQKELAEAKAAKAADPKPEPAK